MNEIKHYGTPRHSGRYPWGSGENPYQSYSNFLSKIDELRKEGKTQVEIADFLNMTTAELRNRISYTKDELRLNNYNQALRLREKGVSVTEIGRRMNMGESSVRSLLNQASLEKAKVTSAIANTLKKEVAKSKYIDIGKGVENHLGISDTKLKVALTKLQDEGYMVYNIPVRQLGTGKDTTVKTLTMPGVEWKEVAQNKNDIQPISTVNPTNDYGRTFRPIEAPKSLNSDRILVRYGNEGGADKDGVIELRRGVEDISLGNANYAQVRIAVDDTHYLKGMAVYSDDLPFGVDMIFNTNKLSTGNKMDAMKKMKLEDPENPFGANIKIGDELIKAQRHYIDKHGNEQQSVLNIVNEEGNWIDWSKNISSQVLSKQQPTLAKQQLQLAYDIKHEEFKEIMQLTNPVIKERLLESFADDCDASAVHLKAAALPRQNTHVILPVLSLRDNEVFAPNYKNGETVVLIRHPHGGRFEIPELTVNNRNAEAKQLFGQGKSTPIDAVGINPKVAQQLSGADFDGDTVIIIPNNTKTIKTVAPLVQLKNFDPLTAYPAIKGMKVMNMKKDDPLVKKGLYRNGGDKDAMMGDISNLITDMTIKGANMSEIARAVKHSMVIIDSEKHMLNYEQSAIDNGIATLKKKYQGASNAGASTIVSRAKSPQYIDQVKEYYKIDKKTGQKIYEPTGATYTNKKGQTVLKKTKATKMELTDDARSLLSSAQGTPIENLYATHANSLKALANQARKEMLRVQPTPYSPSARETYKKEVASLNAKLNMAEKNAPIERYAQRIANARISTIRQDNPDLDNDTLKKLRNSSLQAARARTGAAKQQIVPSEREWEAIQAGAITKTKLKAIINNSDLDKLKQLAMPRTTLGITPSKLNKAESMIKRGYTQAEIAEHLGVPLSTLLTALQEG